MGLFNKCNSVFRLCLKTLLGLVFMIALGNSICSLIYPDIGVTMYKESGAHLPSLTICMEARIDVDKYATFTEFWKNISAEQYFGIDILLDYYGSNSQNR